MIDFVIGVGSVLAALLLAAQMRERGRADLLWSRLWFALALLTFLGFVLARSFADIAGFWAALIYTTALVALYPVQYLHVRAVTGAPARILWPHVLPPLSNVVLIAGLQAMSGARMDVGLLAVDSPQRSWINALTMIVIAILAAYPALSLRRLLNARRAIAFRQGNTAAKRFDWLIAWCAATFLSVIGGWASDLGSQFGFITIDAVAWVTFGTLAVQLLLVGFFVTGTSMAFSPMPETRRTDADIDLERLTAHFREARPYLQSGLSAERLAESLDWTVPRLTQAIRSGGAGHFNDYLNRWRVEQVIDDIQSGADRPVLELALDAGFGSKSSFNEAFKRHTGLTPTEFRRRSGTSG
ncbi:MAG: helix-turn-helix domain-containing protein [Maricaulis sp.]|uniref:AraC family transcriptional regulator n=1 Tax=Maricaulis sp. TaxID=1486257 RepID=UPI002612FA8D|nr:helix-turn-helix domain-containing protein [Maricaulis sp.]MDM7983981.1 helix-turn-helix domain-containing protein [Maricaulis sp.]